jgi:hypothetical protein
VNQLGIFAKYWEPGQVKTRLAADLGDVVAANIYRAFVDTLLRRFVHVADRQLMAYWPPSKLEAFQPIAADWRLQPQADGDLGERMHSYFDNAFGDGCQRVVLLGSDSPNLPVRMAQQAFEMLDDHDLVLGPSEDGGYYLIGARGQTPEIFEGVVWSSAQVWRQTMENVQRAGLKCAALPSWYDVDQIEDLRRLRSDLNVTEDASLIALRSEIDRQWKQSANP